MKLFTKGLSLSLVFALMLMTFGMSSVSAETHQANNESYQEDVEELAILLEVLFEEGIVYNYDGDPVGFDEKVLNESVLTTQYAYLVKDFKELGVIVDSSANDNLFTEKTKPEGVDLAKSKRDAYIDNCIVKKLNDSYGIAAVTAIITAIKKKQYMKAAKKLIKQGVKAAPVVIIANLGWILGSCIYEADKKGL